MIADTIIAKPDAVLCLATGGTPEPVYAELVKKYKLGKLDFKSLTTFNLDEYLGLDPNHNQSYRYYM
jgi:glucosamine-6-phosphate deaminase